MPDEILVGRVEALEQRVTSLEELPPRIDALALQVLQLGEAMQMGFSEIRQEIREGDEETRRLMRVLHEDVIVRIALMNEGR